MEGDVITLQKLFEFHVERRRGRPQGRRRAPADRSAARVPAEVRAARDRAAGRRSSARRGRRCSGRTVTDDGGAEPEAASEPPPRRDRCSPWSLPLAAPRRRPPRHAAADHAGRAGCRSPSAGTWSTCRDGVAARAGRVRVTENGRPVRRRGRSRRSRQAGIRYGVVLAIDASESMTGAPLEAALAAARTFVAHRAAGEQIGIVAFNGRVRVLTAPTLDAAELLRRARAVPRRSRTGRASTTRSTARSRCSTRRSSRRARSCCSPTVPTSAASTTLGSVVARRGRNTCAIFTVGLRSTAFDAQTLADARGARPAVATPRRRRPSAAALDLRRARAAARRRVPRPVPLDAAPKSQVDVAVEIRGSRRCGRRSYTAPTPSGLAPYHRSFALALRALGSCALRPQPAGRGARRHSLIVAVLLRRRRAEPVVERVRTFAGGTPETAPGATADVAWQARREAAARAARGWLGEARRTAARDRADRDCRPRGSCC